MTTAFTLKTVHAAISFLTAIALIVACTLSVTGFSEYFLVVFSFASLFLPASILSGIVRLIFKTNSILLSIVIGALFGGVAYAMALFSVYRQI